MMAGWGGGGGGGGGVRPTPLHLGGWLVTLHHYDLDNHKYFIIFFVVISIVIIMTEMSIFSVASKSSVLIRYPACTQVFKSLR